jgi:SulP family sulfate permease
VVLVAGVIAKFGYQGLAIATMMAGGFLVVMALARLGDVIRFIPYPVTVGFTTGIALIIAFGQFGDAFGLDLERVPVDFLPKLRAYSEHLASAKPAAMFVFLATVAIIQLWPRVSSRIPGPLVALVAATVLVHALGLDVATIQGRFGGVPTSLPNFHLPEIDWGMVPNLVSPALTIALLAAIESLLSAVVADGLTGGRHRSNAELLGQGIANIASPLFGGIPVTGAIARTATNVRNGGRTPVAGIVHALTLLVILLVAGKWASLIPMASLAGILIVVAYNMSEWQAFRRLLRGPRSDVLVLVATFILTVTVDLTVAIQVGVVLASLLFMRRMSDVTQIQSIRDIVEYDRAESIDDLAFEMPAGVEVFEINGSFCFGAARKFAETLLTVQSAPQVVILRMRHVLAMYATGLHALEDVGARLQRRGSTLLLSGVQAQPLVAIQRGGTLQRIGEENVFETFGEAVSRARQMIESA